MPTKDPIAAARREAKARTRKGGVTHQQALDQIAVESGHANWSAMTAAQTRAVAHMPRTDAVRGPSVFLPPLMDEFQYLEPPTLKSVEEQAEALRRKASRRAALRISEWVGSAMREAATRALEGYDARDRRHHPIRPLAMNAQMMAQAVDPEGGPWTDSRKLTVRCPLHGDTNPSLVIAGKGHEMSMRCMAGCDSIEIQDHALGRLAEAAVKAAAFMAANDRSKVISGYGLGPEGQGGRGGVYTLEDGSRHELEVLSCRMLTDGYPDWIHGRVPRGHYALETAIRTELAGRHLIKVDQPKDTARGPWRMEISDEYAWRGDDQDRQQYRIIVQWQRGRPYGISGAWTDDPKVGRKPDETCDTIEEAVSRVRALLRGKNSTNPEVIAKAKARSEREKAYHEAHCGKDEEGWGWWAGPDESSFTYGGPYKTRAYAVSMANGFCSEEGEDFYVIQAKTAYDDPDDEGMYEFSETRGLKRYRAK